jgi:DNA polymerase-1
MLSPFRAKTGRNQPSNSRFIFGPSTWLRGLIKPEPGRAVAYVDWSQQEFGIAASLSGDAAMMDAYQSGDPYLAFGKQAGRVPPDGTKGTHGSERELFKACVLGVQYGMEAESLARRISKPSAYGRELLRLHRETYPAFWRWSDGAESHAMLLGRLHTVFGWTVRIGPDANPRSLRNFPCQANGAEMLRLACSLATERGVSVVAPVHDALMVEGSADAIDDVVARTQEAMAEASEVVLSGFRLRSDVKIVRWPDRYMDGRGREFWGRLIGLLPAESEAGLPGARHSPIPATFDEESREVRGHVEWANAIW